VRRLPLFVPLISISKHGRFRPGSACGAEGEKARRLSVPSEFMERSMAIADPVDIEVIPETTTVSLRRIVWSSVIGTAVEWYDFLIYGAATALVFNKIFFPAGDAALATIAAFGTYAVGFLARPLGAAVFGHYGDRVGRKAMLAVTIIVMGLGTFLIGLLPTYQQIGVAAPVLLVGLRFLQGIGLGGEWGGAVLMVVENCPTPRRGLFGSTVQVGNPVGNLAAIGMFALVGAGASRSRFRSCWSASASTSGSAWRRPLPSSRSRRRMRWRDCRLSRSSRTIAGRSSPPWA
jgi:MFS family permease